MSKRNVYIPAKLIDEIYSITQREHYEALDHLFTEYVKGDTEYLAMDENDATNLLRLADIEISKAMLKYPHNEEDDPAYSPKHEELYDDIMLGVYEKTYYYVTSEFKNLK